MYIAQLLFTANSNYRTAKSYINSPKRSGLGLPKPVRKLVLLSSCWHLFPASAKSQACIPVLAFYLWHCSFRPQVSKCVVCECWHASSWCQVLALVIPLSMPIAFLVEAPAPPNLRLEILTLSTILRSFFWLFPPLWLSSLPSLLCVVMPNLAPATEIANVDGKTTDLITTHFWCYFFVLYPQEINPFFMMLLKSWYFLSTVDKIWSKRAKRALKISAKQYYQTGNFS